MTVQVKVSINRFPKIVRAFPKLAEKVVVRGMQATASFGLTAVQRTTRREKQKPIAHTIYIRSWRVTRTKTGAILGNTSLQSYFVEVGRKPGRAPPLRPILDWVRVKWRILNRKPNKKRQPRDPGAKMERKNPSSLRHALGAGDWRRDEPGGGKPKSPRAPSKKTLAAQLRLARIVQRKIKYRGYAGRPILGKTVPVMVRFLRRELRHYFRVLRPHLK